MSDAERNKVIQIKLLQKEKSFKELAEYLGISIFSLRRRKIGETRYSVEELKKIAVFFDCDVGELI